MMFAVEVVEFGVMCWPTLVISPGAEQGQGQKWYGRAVLEVAKPLGSPVRDSSERSF